MSGGETVRTIERSTAAKVLLFNTYGELLVLWRSPEEERRAGGPDIPGGGIEFGRGESIAEGLIREVREEIGIALGPYDARHCFETTLEIERSNPDRLVQIRWLGFAALLPSGQTPCIEGSREHDRFDWLTPSEFAEKSDYPLHREFVSRARTGLVEHSIYDCELQKAMLLGQASCNQLVDCLQ